MAHVAGRRQTNWLPIPRVPLSTSRKEPLMQISKFLKSFARDEGGVTAIEYGLIAALIAVAIIGAVELVGTGVSTTFNTIAGKL